MLDVLLLMELLPLGIVLFEWQIFVKRIVEKLIWRMCTIKFRHGKNVNYTFVKFLHFIFLFREIFFIDSPPYHW